MNLEIIPIDTSLWTKTDQAEFLGKMKREIDDIARTIEGTVRWKNLNYRSSDFYYFFPSKILAKKFQDKIKYLEEIPGPYKVLLKDTGRQPSYMYPCTPGKTPGIDEDILAMISEVEGD